MGPQKNSYHDHIAGLTVSYSDHCQHCFIHDGMNDQCITMSQWLFFGKNQVCMELTGSIPRSEMS